MVAAVGPVAVPALAAAPAASSSGTIVVVRVGAVIAPVMAVAPAGTPGMAGVFSLIGILPLGVSSVPGKKPPASDILFPPTQSPICQTPRGAIQRNLEMEVGRGSLFPGVGA